MADSYHLPDEDDAAAAAERASDIAGMDDGSVPDDPQTGHEYDGITEFDNPMPGWWKATFWATIWLSVIYVPLLYNGAMPFTIRDSYERAKAANARLMFAEWGDVTAEGATVARFLDEPGMASIGESLYQANCISCHGVDALGLVGPNLRDDYYKHIKTLDDVVNVLQNGAANNAMPAWRNRMDTNEIVAVSTYVATLRGTADGAGKEPEGRLIDPWPAADADAKAADAGAAE